jgi:hypothetical protein
VYVLRCYAIPLHAAVPIDQLGGPDQHFLGVTTAQRTGAPKRAGIHQGYLPSSGTTAMGSRRTRRAGADHNQIKRFCHALSEPELVCHRRREILTSSMRDWRTVQHSPSGDGVRRLAYLFTTAGAGLTHGSAYGLLMKR